MSAHSLPIRFRTYTLLATGLLMIVLALLAVWIGWISLDPDWQHPDRPVRPISNWLFDNMPWWVRAPLFFSWAAGFGYGGILALRRCIDGRPALVLDEEGITRLQLRRKSVRWPDVTAIRANCSTRNHRTTVDRMTFYGHKQGAAQARPQVLFSLDFKVLDYRPGEIEDFVRRVRPDLDLPWLKEL